jgi:hypothetical protein
VEEGERVLVLKLNTERRKKPPKKNLQLNPLQRLQQQQENLTIANQEGQDIILTKTNKKLLKMIPMSNKIPTENRDPLDHFDILSKHNKRNKPKIINSSKEKKNKIDPISHIPQEIPKMLNTFLRKMPLPKVLPKILFLLQPLQDHNHQVS